MVKEFSLGLMGRSTMEISIMASKEGSESGRDLRVIRTSVNGTMVASRAMVFTNGLTVMNMKVTGRITLSLVKELRLSQTEIHTKVITKMANSMALVTISGRMEPRTSDTSPMETRMAQVSGVKMDEQKQANTKVTFSTIKNMAREFSRGKAATAMKATIGWT